MGLFDLFKKKEVQSLADEYYSSNNYTSSTSNDNYSSYKSDNVDYTQSTGNYQEQQYNFEMTIEDVFSLTGRGTVAVGRIEAGTIHKGDAVTILTPGGPITSQIGAIEMFRKVLDSAKAGDNVGLLLSGVQKGEIAGGDRIVK